MTSKQFFNRVAEMRMLQKNYAGTQSVFTRMKMVEAEQEIDKEIARVNLSMSKGNVSEMDLFND